MKAIEKLKLKALCYLSYLIYRVITSTYRVTFYNTEAVKEAAAKHKSGSFVYGLWHEHFFTAVASHAHRGIAPMISQSNDGELISFISEKLGFNPVRGSTSRGGEQARQELYRRINEGLKAAFTADGPRGPRRRLKSGLVDLSRTGQMAIVPIGFAADRCWRLGSWDKSMIPKPFAKIVITHGSPILVPADTHGLAFAEQKKKIAAEISRVCDEAETLAANETCATPSTVKI